MFLGSWHTKEQEKNDCCYLLDLLGKGTMFYLPDLCERKLQNQEFK